MTTDSGSGLPTDPILEVVGGSGIGRRIAVGSGDVVLGRESQAALAFSHDSLISHRHAAISHTEDGVLVITDLDSTNGTFVNGARITGPTRMNSGDVIGLGGTELRLIGADAMTSDHNRARDTVMAPMRQPSLDPWVSWIQQTFAGHPSAIKAATDAATAAIARGANTDEIANAAQAAANEAAAAESASAWTAWAQQSYGGDPRRIQAATEAALSAIARGANTDQASAAARAAADAAALETPPALLPSHAASHGQRPPVSYTGGRLRGRVTGYQQRYETYGRRQVYVWDFQLDGQGSSGAPTHGTVAIEMRGFGFKGAIKEGDEVEISKSAQPGKVIRVRRVRNLTSNSLVKVRGHPALSRAARIIGAIVILIGIAIFALFIITHIRGSSS
jgi:pSer/pThr/pTyr-binding forkhead associated (FHA) protein